MKRRDFLKLAGLLRLALPSKANQSSAKPNIIFILASDLGIGGLSCYGADNFKTPNIDKLAATGTRFTYCYTAPLPGPSRAMMLTGRYAFRTGATSQDASSRMDPADEKMLPGYLKTAGYASACVGKWGQLPLTPLDFGFDEQWKARETNQYPPDQMHDFLVEFISKHSESPFFVYYALAQVHGDIQPTPDSAPENKDLYFDNILYMDKLVGKLVAELERLKLRDRTLIVFTSDNGTGTVYAGESTIGGRRLTGEKGSMREGGSLVPLIANWPGKIPSATVSANLIDSTDFVPTFADLAGAELPPDEDFDGHRFLGNNAEPRDWVFIELGKSWYVRDTAWKLNQAGELFDMRSAPFEETLVGNTEPSAIAARKRLQAVLEKLDPSGGIVDGGDGSGRRNGRRIHTRKKKKAN